MRWIAIAASASATAAGLTLWAPWRDYAHDPWPWLALIPLTTAFVHAVAAIAPSPRRWFATGVATGVVLGLLTGFYWIAAFLVLVTDPGGVALAFWLGWGFFTCATAFSLLMAVWSDMLTAPIPTARVRT